MACVCVPQTCGSDLLEVSQHLIYLDWKSNIIYQFHVKRVSESVLPDLTVRIAKILTLTVRIAKTLILHIAKTLT